jgi:hypothetical protein
MDDTPSPSLRARRWTALGIWLGLCLAPAVAAGVFMAADGSGWKGSLVAFTLVAAHLAGRIETLLLLAVSVWMTHRILHGKSRRWFIFQTVLLVLCEASNSAIPFWLYLSGDM